MSNQVTTGPTIAAKFLRDFAGFGSRIHYITANSLSRILDTTKDQQIRKLLAAKIFMELMNAIEDLAGLCVAIKHRQDGIGLIVGFMNYDSRRKHKPETSVKDFYQSILDGEDLFTYLGLPSFLEVSDAGLTLDTAFVAEINEQLISRGVIKPDKDLSAGEYLRGLYTELPLVFDLAAKMYLAEEPSLVKAYYQGKHGFKAIEDATTFQNDEPQLVDDVCWLFVDNSEYSDETRGEQSPLELTGVDVGSVGKILNNIYMLSLAAKAICLLTASLIEVN